MLGKTNGHYCNNFYMPITIFRSYRSSFDKTVSVLFCYSITIACDTAHVSKSNKQQTTTSIFYSHEQISVIMHYRKNGSLSTQIDMLKEVLIQRHSFLTVLRKKLGSLTRFHIFTLQCFLRLPLALK